MKVTQHALIATYACTLARQWVRDMFPDGACMREIIDNVLMMPARDRRGWIAFGLSHFERERVDEILKVLECEPIDPYLDDPECVAIFWAFNNMNDQEFLDTLSRIADMLKGEPT